MEGPLTLDRLDVHNARELAALTGESVAAWEHRAAQWPRWRNWIVRVDGEPVGFVQATHHGAATELAWVIGERFQRRGYATAAAEAMIAELGHGPFIAHIAPANRASQRVAERIGMRRGPARADGEERWEFRPAGLTSSAPRATSHPVERQQQ
jgi:RimJ/RimL family protein N-acetyltransferase